MKRWLWVVGLVVFVALGCGKNTPGDDDDDNNNDDNTPNPVVPVANAGSDWNPLAGMSVPLIASASQNADQFLWEQISGPSLTIRDADQPIAYVDVAAGTAAATQYEFQVTVTSTTSDVDRDSMLVTVTDPTFDDFLAAITDPAELDTTEGIAFNSEGLWVGSTEGFVSLFDSTGAFQRNVQVGTNIIGINFVGPDRLLVAVTGSQSVEILNTGNGALTLITDQDALGGALGSVNYVLPDVDGNIFFTNFNGGTVFRYDEPTDTTHVFLSGLAQPNSVAFGPEPDRLYVGTNGQVLRVVINADGSAGASEVYVDGLPSFVDGLVFDAGLNLWMGPAGRSLHVAPYAATGTTTVTRSFNQPAAGYDRFINPVFGSGAFGDTTIYWTNLGDQSVGRMDIGVPVFVPPAATVP